MRTLLAMVCALILFGVPAWADKIDVTTASWVTAGGWLDWNADPDPNKPSEAPPSTLNVTDITFEFEQFDAGFVYGDGDVAEATFATSFGMVTLQITRPGSIFQFTDLSPYSEGAGLAGGVPDDWGTRSLDPFIDMTNPAGWQVTAIVPVGYAVLNTSIQLGDFSPSDKDELGWDGEPGVLNNNLGEPLAANPFATLQMGGISNYWNVESGAPMPESSYFFGGVGGGPDQPMSLFWDNLVVSIVAVDDLPTTAVAPAIFDPANSDFGPGYLPDLSPPASPIPEPGSLALLGAGLAAFALWRRRSS